MEEQGPQQAGCLHPIYPRPGDQGQHTIALALGAAENPHAPDHVDLRLLQARPPNPLGVSESWTSRLRQHLAQLPAPVVQGSNILSKDRTERSAGGEARGQRESEDKVSEFRREGWDTTAAGERSETRTPICRQPRPAGPAGFVGRDENPKRPPISGPQTYWLFWEGLPELPGWKAGEEP